jgi:hypothetical protein
MSYPRSAVTSKAIRFPWVNNNNLTGYGIPGLPYQGVAVAQSGAGTKPVVPDASFANPGSLVQLVQVPKPSGGLPLRAISIASDSAISACNISVGGNLDSATSRKVSVGCPLIGEFESEFVSVATLINVINFSSSGGQWVWDGAPFASSDVPQNFNHPLRLDFWWGDILQAIPAVRAPLHAEFVITNVGATSTTSMLCVDGRRRIRVTALTPAATTPTITINQLYGFAQNVAQPNFPSTAIKLVTGPTALAASVPFVFEIGQGAAGLETLGFPFMSIIVADPAGSPSATTVHVHAID